MSIITMTLILKEIYTPLTYILIFLIYIIAFKVIFYDSIEAIYSIVTYKMFHMILYRDISIGILSIVCKKNIFQIVVSYETYLLSFFLCELFMVIYLIGFKKKYNMDISKKLFINRNRLKISKLTLIILFVMLINSNYMHYYSNTSIALSYFVLINRTCIGLCFYLSLKMGMKAIIWSEEEILYKTNLLNVEHNEEINNKIDEYSNLLKMYNHDFKNILFNIKDSIEIGNTEKAKKIILEFNEQIDSFTNYNKKLANNSLVNALLNRLHETCKSKNIYFDSNCYIPREIVISEVDLLKIFNNLVSNALEACDKQDSDEKKRIRFKSYIKDNEFIIYQENSFNGHIKFKNDRLITTKKNKNIHGIGVESIKHIINEANGMVLVNADKEKKEFKILIKMPLSI
ncbi:hypothetical protein B2H97_08585 [Paraclostridium bifermentans]|nr:hypothetical protein B2H97_08585 [Paraclostridium bifermentans]